MCISITFDAPQTIFLSLEFQPFFLCTGGCCGAARVRTIIGGWAWAWWFVTQVQK